MPYISPFSSRRNTKAPQPKVYKPHVVTDMRGLDLTSPYDSIRNNRSPFAKNFRIYAEEGDDRRVSISSRKGSGFYTTPLSEATFDTEVATTGAADQNIGIITDWKADKFTATAVPLTMVELRVKNPGTATGNLIVAIYTDVSGSPGELVAKSGILGSSITSSYAYVQARFIEAPTLTNAANYWIVVYMQDDGSGMYQISSTTAVTTAKTSNTTGQSWATTTYGLNYKAYGSSTSRIKGMTRYAPTSNQNKTIVAIGNSIYTVNDNTGVMTELLGGFNASATDVYFTKMDNKVFWANGYDDLHSWDGTDTTTNSNLVTNGTFETNITGWTGGTGTTATRTTTAGEFRTGVAAMKLVGSGGNPAAATFVNTFTKGKRYTLTAYVKGTAAQQVKLTANGQESAAQTLSGGFDLITFTFIATTSTASTYGVKSVTNNATIYVDDVDMRFTGIQTITHTELPVLTFVIAYKERLWGISALDPNRIVFSEVPGNDDGAGNEWYDAYLSTNYRYVPSPKASDPITAMVPFQDSLAIFTRASKYILYGSDKSNFTLRESTGKKGAVKQNATFADENFIYFVSTDGLYRFNGSSDQIISDMTPQGGGSVQSEYDSIADVNKVFVTKWKRQIRFYYPHTGSPANDRCLLFHTVFQEWQMDTDANVSHATPWTDGNDDQELVEASSGAPTLYYAEQEDHNLGKAIDFEYHCTYDSMGNPAIRKRIVKFFPLLEGEGTNYSVSVGMDKDRQNTPRYTDYPLTVGGALIGSFDLDDGVTLGRVVRFEPKRIRASGYAYYWQVRVKREAINNPIQFIGYVVSIRAKRL